MSFAPKGIVVPIVTPVTKDGKFDEKAYRGLIDYLADGATTANRRRSLMDRFRIMAHYYGLLPTVGRHLGFIGRFFRHQHRLNQSRNQ